MSAAAMVHPRIFSPRSHLPTFNIQQPTDKQRGLSVISLLINQGMESQSHGLPIAFNKAKVQDEAALAEDPAAAVAPFFLSCSRAFLD